MEMTTKTTMPTKFVVRLEFWEWTSGQKAETRHQVSRFVTGISTGKGDRVKSVRHSADRSKAFGFSKLFAEQIAAMYGHAMATIEPQ